MIVITGASGHIGNNLVRILIKRKIPFKVLLRREGKELAGLKIEKHIGNLYDSAFYREHINHGDVVVHLAGYIDLENKDYDQSYKANFEMTKIIADICLEKEVRLIYASSTDVLFHSENNGFYVERDVRKVKYNYPKTKTMATLYIKELQEKGLNAIILYPTSVIGINDYKGSQAGKEIIKASKKTFLPYVKGGYDFVDVIDVSNAIIEAAYSDLTEDVIINGHFYTLKELYKLIGKLTGKKKVMVYIPTLLAKFGTLFIKGLSPMMVEIVRDARPFKDPNTKLLLKENTPIEITFKSVLSEAGHKNKQKRK